MHTIACFSLMVAICVVFICCSNTKSLTTALSSVMAATMASWSHRIQFSPQGQLRNLVEFVLAGISVMTTYRHTASKAFTNHHVTYLGGQLAQINIKNNFNFNINAPNCL